MVTGVQNFLLESYKFNFAGSFLNKNKFSFLKQPLGNKLTIPESLFLSTKFGVFPYVKKIQAKAFKRNFRGYKRWIALFYCASCARLNDLYKAIFKTGKGPISQLKTNIPALFQPIVDLAIIHFFFLGFNWRKETKFITIVVQTTKYIKIA